MFAGAGTIHHLLGIKQGFQWTPDEVPTTQIKADLLVIDEASMLDMEMMFLLMHSIPPGCKVVFIGDSDQLPSVGAGSVLKDLIESKVVPVSVLDTIYRQAKTSRIIINADAIRHDSDDLDIGDDFQFIEVSEESAEQLIIQQYKDALEVRHLTADDVQILTPFRKEKFVASVPRFNKAIQAYLNPPRLGKQEINVGYTCFRPGDKVIRQKNAADSKSDIKNGDIGYIQNIFVGESGERTATIDFGEGRIQEYNRAEIEENIPTF